MILLMLLLLAVVVLLLIESEMCELCEPSLDCNIGGK
jgi:hypothetical protein